MKYKYYVILMAGTTTWRKIKVNQNRFNSYEQARGYADSMNKTPNVLLENGIKGHFEVYYEKANMEGY